MRGSVAGKVAVLLLSALPAFAADNNWNSSNSGLWQDGSKWSLGVPPTNTQTAVFVSNAGSKIVTNNATTSGSFPGTMTVSNLQLSSTATTTNTLLLHDAGLVTPLRVLNGLTNLNGCVLSISNSILRVEGNPDGEFPNDGFVRLTSGSLITTGTVIKIGDLARGDVTVSGGTFLAKTVSVADQLPATGTLTLAGLSSNVFTSTLFIASDTGTTGSVWMSANKLLVKQSAIYVGYFGVGRMTVSNGTLEASSLIVGYNNGAQGTLNLAGGNYIISGSIYLAQDGGAPATVVMTDGLLQVTNGAINFCTANFNGGTPTAQMTISSNATVIGRDVIMGQVGGSQSTLRFAGGFTTLSRGLTVGQEVGAAATVWMTGGQLSVTNAPTLVGSNGVGQVIVSNGTAIVRELVVSRGGSSQGTFTLAGGSVTTDNLVLTNTTGRAFLLGGTLHTKSTSVTNGQTFVVGTGTNPAALHLLGGVHSYNNGLRVSTNAFLNGCGTISGVVVNFGTITNNCTTLNFLNAFTNTANGRIFANGGTLNFFAPVVNNGLINSSAGSVRFFAGVSGPGTIILDGGGDADGDGLTNAWEQMFALDPLSASGDNGGAGDPDGDGYSNSDEFFASTAPNNGNSFPRVLQVTFSGNDAVASIQSASGKTYQLQRRDALESDSWTDTGIVVGGTGSIVQLVDPGGALQPKRQYRVKITP